MVSPVDPVFPKRRESQTSPPGAENTPPAASPRQEALPLAGGGQPSQTASFSSAIKRKPAIWFAIRLPWLAFEALGESPRADRPLAVVIEEGGQLLVHLAGRRARECGVHAGQTLNTALALVPALEILQRRPAREQQTLEDLGGWAGRFSPLVSLEPPDSLLLEVRGSLRLFRGLDRLHRLVSDGLSQRGYHARVVAAPTPQAALWLSRGEEKLVHRLEELPRHLGPLDLRVTGWPAKILGALDGMGIRTIGQCWRLPREGFTRRMGREYLLALDRAFGRCPDPRQHFSVPLRFADQLDLTEESLQQDLLMEACRRLLQKLEHFLLHHQRAARRLRFRFFHLRGAATALTLGFSEAGCDVAHWEGLLWTRLERLRLPSPVIAVGVVTGRLEPQRSETTALPFGCKAEVDETSRGSSLRLVESLRARLGDEAVLGLKTLAEHRPQQAWDAVDPVHAAAASAGADLSPWCRLESVPAEIEGLRHSGSLLLQRPLWMLSSPQRLVVRDGRPCHDGPLCLVNGPERIESGWWDGADAARDYYVAETADGIRLWIYRDRRRRASWYLQGIFG